MTIQIRRFRSNRNDELPQIHRRSPSNLTSTPFDPAVLYAIVLVAVELPQICTRSPKSVLPQILHGTEGEALTLVHYSPTSSSSSPPPPASTSSAPSSLTTIETPISLTPIVVISSSDQGSEFRIHSFPLQIEETYYPKKEKASLEEGREVWCCWRRQRHWRKKPRVPGSFDLKFVKYLRAGLREVINKTSDGGITALHMAALNGHADSVQLLLDLGASVSEVAVEDGTTIDLIGAGSTPLHYAARGGNA